MKEHILNRYKLVNVKSDYSRGESVSTRSIENSDEDYFSAMDPTVQTFTDEATDEDSIC